MSLSTKNNAKITNRPSGGGSKLQGLPSLKNQSASSINAIKKRGGGDRRNLIFCINQLGGIGRHNSQFSSSADNVNCRGEESSHLNNNNFIEIENSLLDYMNNVYNGIMEQIMKTAEMNNMPIHDNLPNMFEMFAVTNEPTTEGTPVTSNFMMGNSISNFNMQMMPNATPANSSTAMNNLKAQIQAMDNPDMMMAMDTIPMEQMFMCIGSDSPMNISMKNGDTMTMHSMVMDATMMENINNMNHALANQNITMVMCNNNVKINSNGTMKSPMELMIPENTVIGQNFMNGTAIPVVKPNLRTTTYPRKCIEIEMGVSRFNTNQLKDDALREVLLNRTINYLSRLISYKYSVLQDLSGNPILENYYNAFNLCKEQDGLMARPVGGSQGQFIFNSEETIVNSIISRSGPGWPNPYQQPWVFNQQQSLRYGTTRLDQSIASNYINSLAINAGIGTSGYWMNGVSDISDLVLGTSEISNNWKSILDESKLYNTPPTSMESTGIFDPQLNTLVQTFNITETSYNIVLNSSQTSFINAYTKADNSNGYLSFIDASNIDTIKNLIASRADSLLNSYLWTGIIYDSSTSQFNNLNFNNDTAYAVGLIPSTHSSADVSYNNTALCIEVSNNFSVNSPLVLVPRDVSGDLIDGYIYTNGGSGPSFSYSKWASSEDKYKKYIFNGGIDYQNAYCTYVNPLNALYHSVPQKNYDAGDGLLSIEYKFQKKIPNGDNSDLSLVKLFNTHHYNQRINTDNSDVSIFNGSSLDIIKTNLSKVSDLIGDNFDDKFEVSDDLIQIGGIFYFYDTIANLDLSAIYISGNDIYKYGQITANYNEIGSVPDYKLLISKNIDGSLNLSVIDSSSWDNNDASFIIYETSVTTYQEKKAIIMQKTRDIALVYINPVEEQFNNYWNIGNKNSAFEWGFDLPYHKIKLEIYYDLNDPLFDRDVEILRNEFNNETNLEVAQNNSFRTPYPGHLAANIQEGYYILGIRGANNVSIIIPTYPPLSCETSLGSNQPYYSIAFGHSHFNPVFSGYYLGRDSNGNDPRTFNFLLSGKPTVTPLMDYGPISRSNNFTFLYNNPIYLNQYPGFIANCVDVSNSPNSIPFLESAAAAPALAAVNIACPLQFRYTDHYLPYKLDTDSSFVLNLMKNSGSNVADSLDWNFDSSSGNVGYLEINDLYQFSLSNARTNMNNSTLSNTDEMTNNSDSLTTLLSYQTANNDKYDPQIEDASLTEWRNNPDNEAINDPSINLWNCLDSLDVSGVGEMSGNTVKVNMAELIPGIMLYGLAGVSGEGGINVSQTDNTLYDEQGNRLGTLSSALDLGAAIAGRSYFGVVTNTIGLASKYSNNSELNQVAQNVSNTFNSNTVQGVSNVGIVAGSQYLLKNSLSAEIGGASALSNATCPGASAISGAVTRRVLARVLTNAIIEGATTSLAYKAQSVLLNRLSELPSTDEDSSTTSTTGSFTTNMIRSVSNDVVLTSTDMSDIDQLMSNIAQSASNNLSSALLQGITVIGAQYVGQKGLEAAQEEVARVIKIGAEKFIRNVSAVAFTKGEDKFICSGLRAVEEEAGAAFGRLASSEVLMILIQRTVIFKSLQVSITNVAEDSAIDRVTLLGRLLNSDSLKYIKNIGDVLVQADNVAGQAVDDLAVTIRNFITDEVVNPIKATIEDITTRARAAVESSTASATEGAGDEIPDGLRAPPNSVRSLVNGMQSEVERLSTGDDEKPNLENMSAEEDIDNPTGEGTSAEAGADVGADAGAEAGAVTGDGIVETVGLVARTLGLVVDVIPIVGELFLAATILMTIVETFISIFHHSSPPPRPQRLRTTPGFQLLTPTTKNALISYFENVNNQPNLTDQQRSNLIDQLQRNIVNYAVYYDQNGQLQRNFVGINPFRLNLLVIELPRNPGLLYGTSPILLQASGLNPALSTQLWRSGTPIFNSFGKLALQMSLTFNSMNNQSLNFDATFIQSVQSGGRMIYDRYTSQITDASNQYVKIFLERTRDVHAYKTYLDSSGDALSLDDINMDNETGKGTTISQINAPKFPSLDLVYENSNNQVVIDASDFLILSEVVSRQGYLNTMTINQMESDTYKHYMESIETVNGLYFMVDMPTNGFLHSNQTFSPILSTSVVSDNPFNNIDLNTVINVSHNKVSNINFFPTNLLTTLSKPNQEGLDGYYSNVGQYNCPSFIYESLPFVYVPYVNDDGTTNMFYSNNVGKVKHIFSKQTLNIN